MQYKKKEISDRILDAGRKEYFEKGYRAGNICTIAKVSEVPVGNLYRYFDGKMGLLTAIVRPAYKEVPKLLDELFAVVDEEPKGYAYLLTQKLLDIFDKYGTDLLILADKCASTRYEDFFDKLVEQCDRLILKRLFPEPTKADTFFSRSVSRSFLSALFEVLRGGESREENEQMIERLINFYFADIRTRLATPAEAEETKEDSDE